MGNTKNVFIIVLLVSMYLTSCGRTEIDREFSEIENLMKHNPDDALLALSDINIQNLKSQYAKAKYHLLLVAANDKCYNTHEDLSGIEFAVNYFDKYGTNEEKATALFYRGRLYNDLDSLDLSLVSFLKAHTLLSYTDDYYLKGLVNFHIANLYMGNFELEYASRYAKDALHYFTLSKDYLNIGLSFNLMARILMLNDEYTQAINYYMNGINCFYEINREDLIITNIAAIASMHLQNLNDPAKAYLTLTELYGKFNIDEVPIAHYPLISYILSGMGKHNEAKKIIIKFMNYDDSPEQLATAYYMKSEFEYELGEYQSAYNSLNNYVDLTDSLNLAQTNTLFAEIENKYEQKELKNSYANYIKQSRYRISIICLLLLKSIFMLAYFIQFSKRKSKKHIKEKEDLEILVETLRDNTQHMDELKEMVDVLLNVSNDKEIKLKELMYNKLLHIQKIVDITSIYDQNPELFLKKIKLHIIESEKDKYYGELHEVVNDRFYGIIDYLKTACPSLNEDEINLCCLVCFGFTNNQLRILFGHNNHNSIFTKRYKIRKKLNVDSISLEHFIENLIAELREKNNSYLLAIGVPNLTRTKS